MNRVRTTRWNRVGQCGKRERGPVFSRRKRQMLERSQIAYPTSRKGVRVG